MTLVTNCLLDQLHAAASLINSALVAFCARYYHDNAVPTFVIFELGAHIVMCTVGLVLEAVSKARNVTFTYRPRQPVF